jgi:hypothetical protein
MEIARRGFICRVPALLALGEAGAQDKRPSKILLRGSWQSVNIGDIGHTPGALALLQKHFPEAEITLWPGKLGHGLRELLSKGYPKLKIVEGSLDSQGKPTTPELAQAWADTDLYLSGSGSGFSCQRNMPSRFTKRRTNRWVCLA